MITARDRAELPRFRRFKRPFSTLLVAYLLLTIGCSGSKVVLQDDKGGKKLVYDAKNFQPQVETPEDIAILVHAAVETLSDAAGNQSMVTVQEISDSMDQSDWRRLEKAVVRYRASHRE
jgi:hypothetical protein